MNGYSAHYDAALAFAARAHRNQLRKGTETPYIAHVVHVSVILIRHGYDEDLTIAGLLHDVIEDCDVAAAEVEALFNPRVAQLVLAVSETKEADGKRRSWEDRKTEKLAHLRAGGADVAALKAADAIHNARSMTADLRAVGPSLWDRFKRGAEPTLWYYREVLTAVQDKLGDAPIARELAEAVGDLSQAVQDHA